MKRSRERADSPGAEPAKKVRVMDMLPPVGDETVVAWTAALRRLNKGKIALDREVRVIPHVQAGASLNPAL